jgi:hypothetical protein
LKYIRSGVLQFMQPGSSSLFAYFFFFFLIFAFLIITEDGQETSRMKNIGVLFFFAFKNWYLLHVKLNFKQNIYIYIYLSMGNGI